MMSFVPRRLAVLLTATVLLSTLGACTSAGGGATAGAASPAPSIATATGAPSTACPTEQPPALAAGETRTVTMETEKGTIGIKLEADLSPIAVGNFAALVACGFYDGVVFHRVVPGFVIQGGDGHFGKQSALDPNQVGTGGPGYEIQDEPVTATYKRGTVAMARSSQPNSVGSQFFIVLDDAAATSLADPSANNYQIIGTVTTGMDVADAITAAADQELPTDPVAMTTVTIANP
jgi:cyclophilin family peptidyl-prolyl cis-trans isomerase